MRNFFKNVASVFLIPLARWYLQKERKYDYKGISITVMPGVFHPGFFSSTKFIVQYLNHQSLANKTFLEVGSGTGLISIIAAKANARVTALDFSKTAIENTTRNARLNDVELSVVHSDLFSALQNESFDWIVINPPYYARDPGNESDLAWYCGRNFEYFHNLFGGLARFLHPGSVIIMVLTKNCDLTKIFSLGKQAGFDFNLIQERTALFDEKDFLFSLRFTAFDGAAV